MKRQVITYHKSQYFLGGIPINGGPVWSAYFHYSRFEVLDQ